VNPVRVLLAGDWHGNRAWAEVCFDMAAVQACQVVLQLGDFGLWPGREDEWLDHVDGLAERSGTELVWIDGNHENHDALRLWQSQADETGMVAMRDRVRWASRGARWDWAGTAFGALGGAVSIDRFLRREGVNWWPAEALTQDDVDRLGDAPLDVLVTHAAPSTFDRAHRRVPIPQAILSDVTQVRDLLDQAVLRTNPRLVVHGHYHRRLTAELEERTVEGLAHDKSTPADALAVLDLASGLSVQAV